MIDKIWLKLLFVILGNKDYIVKTKERGIERLLDYRYQCSVSCDAINLIDELIDRLAEKQVIVRVTDDLSEVLKSLPEKYLKVLKLRLKDKKLYWKIAMLMGCGIRNVIYLYNKAMGAVEMGLAKKGYDNDAFFDLFEGDKLVENIFARLYENELEDKEADFSDVSGRASSL